MSNHKSHPTREDGRRSFSSEKDSFVRGEQCNTMLLKLVFDLRAVIRSPRNPFNGLADDSIEDAIGIVRFL
jgi:hypothetical protein